MDRYISVASFFSNCTRIEAENTVKETDTSLTARGSAASGFDEGVGVVARCGMDPTASDPNKEEKNPVPPDCLVDLAGSATRFFSVPDVYTHFIT